MYLTKKTENIPEDRDKQVSNLGENLCNINLYPTEKCS